MFSGRAEYVARDITGIIAAHPRRHARDGSVSEP